MWSALPLLTLSAVTADPRVVDVMVPEEWALGGGLFTYAHQFMYVDNDADRMLYLGRMMTVLLRLLLGGLLYSWAFEWFGWTTAAAALAIYTLEPNLSAHATRDHRFRRHMFHVWSDLLSLWRTVQDSATRQHRVSRRLCGLGHQQVLRPRPRPDHRMPDRDRRDCASTHAQAGRRAGRPARGDKCDGNLGHLWIPLPAKCIARLA